MINLISDEKENICYFVTKVKNYTFVEKSIKQLRPKAIPKEAPWKTSALNKQFRKKRNGEFSVRYVWDGAGARLRWNSFGSERKQAESMKIVLFMYFLIVFDIGIRYNIQRLLRRSNDARRAAQK